MRRVNCRCISSLLKSIQLLIILLLLPLSGTALSPFVVLFTILIPFAFTFIVLTPLSVTFTALPPFAVLFAALTPLPVPFATLIPSFLAGLVY